MRFEKPETSVIMLKSTLIRARERHEEENVNCASTQVSRIYNLCCLNG